MKSIPHFALGVLALVNNLYYKYPKGTLIIGYATDVLTSHGYNYSFAFNDETEEFELIPIE
jgi:hypothetical protein